MGFADAMDLDGPASPEAAACSICLEPVAARAGGERSTARLQCGHEFHLDCIGSAFNAKGAMQCPNCRKIEKGRWLYANGHRSSSHFDIGGWMTDETYHHLVSDHEFLWCPFSGLTPMTSVFEESESELTFGDYSSVASSSLVCPHLAMHGFHHPIYAPSSSTSSTEGMPFHRRPTGMERPATADLSNTQIFHESEPRNHETERQYLGNLPVSGNPNHSAAPFGIGLPRHYVRNQQRSIPYVHPHSLLHRPTPRSASSPVAQLRSAPTVVSETTSHGHGMTGRVHQQTTLSSMPSNLHPPTTRRVRARALAITSFIAASSSTQTGEHDFSHTGAANTTDSNLHNGVGASRHANQPYNGGRETFPAPRVGEPHRWGAFTPVRNQAYGSFAGRSATELLTMYGARNGHQPVPHRRMPPFL